jgi:hypothetical protein
MGKLKMSSSPRQGPMPRKELRVFFRFYQERQTTLKVLALLCQVEYVFQNSVFDDHGKPVIRFG